MLFYFSQEQIKPSHDSTVTSQEEEYSLLFFNRFFPTYLSLTITRHFSLPSSLSLWRWQAWNLFCTLRTNWWKRLISFSQFFSLALSWINLLCFCKVDSFIWTLLWELSGEDFETVTGIGHVYNNLTIQLWIGIPRITQSKSYYFLLRMFGNSKIMLYWMLLNMPYVDWLSSF